MPSTTILDDGHLFGLAPRLLCADTFLSCDRLPTTTTHPPQLLTIVCPFVLLLRLAFPVVTSHMPVVLVRSDLLLASRHPFSLPPSRVCLCIISKIASCFCCVGRILRFHKFLRVGLEGGRTMVSWKRIENLDTGSAVVSCPLSLSAFSWTRSVEAFFVCFLL